MIESGAESNYSGRTINERLFVAGLLDEFAAAAEKRDRGRMIELLQAVAFKREGADQIANVVLANPGKY
jgi:hypothetical protein